MFNRKHIYFAAVMACFSLTFADMASADGIYQKVLTCDENAAVVDQNLVSPKYPQVVIRNPQIVAYLRSKGVVANDRNEIILLGVNDLPVISGSDFHGFLDLNGTDWVRREGTGIRVSFNRLEEAHNSDCGTNIPNDSPSCQSHMLEIANWYFQNCN